MWNKKNVSSSGLDDAYMRCLMLYSRAYMKNTKLGSVQIYYSAYNKAAVLVKKLTIVNWSLMQLITVTILLVIHGNPTATVFTKLYIYL